jgi:hypothetical protein
LHRGRAVDSLHHLNTKNNSQLYNSRSGVEQLLPNPQQTICNSDNRVENLIIDVTGLDSAPVIFLEEMVCGCN